MMTTTRIYAETLSDARHRASAWREEIARAGEALAGAVVGSRRAPPYGIEIAERLGFDLATRGVTVVSGLARGIDSAAHRGALEAGGGATARVGAGGRPG